MHWCSFCGIVIVNKNARFNDLYIPILPIYMHVQLHSTQRLREITV